MALPARAQVSPGRKSIDATIAAIVKSEIPAVRMLVSDVRPSCCPLTASVNEGATGGSVPKGVVSIIQGTRLFKTGDTSRASLSGVATSVDVTAGDLQRARGRGDDRNNSTEQTGTELLQPSLTRCGTFGRQQV